MCFSCHFPTTGFSFDQKLHNTRTARSLSASRPLLPSFAWRPWNVVWIGNLPCWAAGAGETLFVRALTNELSVDVVDGRHVRCREIWTTWRWAAFVTSAKNIAVWAEWLRQSGRAPSEPWETPRWHNARCPAPIPCVTLHITLPSRLCRFFLLYRYPIVNKHSVTIRQNGSTEYITKMYISLEAARKPPRHFPDAPRPSWSFAKCSQTLHEHSPVLLKAPAVMEVHSGRYKIWLLRWSNFGAAETTAQLCRRHGAVFSKPWFLGFHKHKAFRVSYSSLVESQDSLPHNMACIIQVSLYIYIDGSEPTIDIPQRLSRHPNGLRENEPF